MSASVSVGIGVMVFRGCGSGLLHVDKRRRRVKQTIRALTSAAQRTYSNIHADSSRALKLRVQILDPMVRSLVMQKMPPTHV